MKKHTLWLSASIATLLSAAAVQAQTAPSQATSSASASPAADRGASLEEVVVTAERRTVNLQQSAVAASVVSGADLAKAGVTSVNDLETIMPSVTVQNFGQGNDFNIRGIGKGAQNSGTLTGVVTYRDGVATFPGYFQTEPYYDIASLEVLRGPQGTFAGQNATGGAVFITEANPNFRGLHGYIQGQYGNYNDTQLQGAVNLPISDTLAARFAFDDEYHDSFYSVSGNHKGDPGQEKASSERFSLLWQPLPALKVLYKVDYNYINLGGLPADPFNAPEDMFHISNNANNLYIDQFVRNVLDISYKFSNGITLRSVSGYQTGRTAAKLDLDGTDLANFTFKDAGSESLASQEFNLISPDSGPLTWVLGAYYSYDVITFPKGTGYDIAEPTAFGQADIRIDGSNPKETKAVFGQVSYKLPAGFELQVGLRYTDFRTANYAEETESVGSFLLAALPDNQTEHDDKLTGKVALNWTIDPYNFLYAFVATGHKGGGLNTPLSPVVLPPTFGPEDVTDYELGWKSTLLDGHLKTQIGGYYNDYKNFQVAIGNPDNPTQSLELNVPHDSKLYGLEAQAEGNYGAFSFNLGAALSHSQLGSFYAEDPRLLGTATCNANSGPASATCQNVSGHPQVYAPTFTFNAGAQYVFDLGNGDTLTPRANFSHIGGQWATIFDDVALGDRLGARDLLGAQIAYQHQDWTLTAYGTNLTDQHYVSAINSSLRYAGAPRQYGVRLMKSF